jgi:transcriptional regulator
MVEKINMIKWRRAKVLELNSQGNNQSEIARVMQDGISTIQRFKCFQSALFGRFV